MNNNNLTFFFKFKLQFHSIKKNPEIVELELVIEFEAD